MAATAASRFLESQLFQVDPRDPATLVLVAALMAAVALAATFWPTWRNAQVDPAAVLRSS